MRSQDLLARFAPSVQVSPDEVRAGASPDAVLVVLDDDPTGTQSVAGLPVLTRWERADLDSAFATGAPAVYVLTNTRSLDELTTERRVREVVSSAIDAAHAAGLRATFVSRGDSTLRGHFPFETDVISDEIAARGHLAPALTLLVPAFPEAGRITVDSVHYWVVDGEATPVGDTPFANDPTFGFASSNLRDWVAEKSDGRIVAEDVAPLTLDVIRSGVDAVHDVLSRLPDGTVVVVDTAEENDMRVVALAVQRLTDRNTLLRVGPPYVRAHVGQAVADPVRVDDITFAHDRGGLVVVGSHVPLTTRQLAHLQSTRPDTTNVELDVRRIMGKNVDAYLSALVRNVTEGLADATVVLHTSRERIDGCDGLDSLAIARRVSESLVRVVAGVLAVTPPRFIVAKGGITSNDIASEAMLIRHATVIGPMLPGIVSLWEPETGPAVGIPFVVFAGNVGAPDSLSRVVDTLSAPGISCETHPA